jgi:hypothetical protein
MAMKAKAAVAAPAGAERNPPAKAGRTDALSRYAFWGTVAAWLLLLVGQRVLDSSPGLSKALTLLAVAGLGAGFAQRLFEAQQAPADRREAARALAVVSGIGLLALAAWAATTEWGRGIAGVEKPALGKPDTYADVLTVAWVTLLTVSLVPSVLGELARHSMLRAARFESRRVLSAVVAGAAVAMAASYGALFTYAAGKLDVSADFSYFRVGRPSDATRRMVESLEAPLKVLVFYPPKSEVREQVMRYLEELGRGTDRLQIESHDRVLAPDLAKEHKVRQDGVLVLVRDKSSRTLELGDELGQAAAKLKKLDGEFQKVLIQTIRDKRTAYFTVGHEELNQVNDKKTGKAAQITRQLLEGQNYTIKDLGMAQGLGDRVPDDADVVVVLGPSQPFAEREVESLKAYADRGGKLFMALDPDDKVDLAPLAAIVGLKWEPGIIANDQVMFRLYRSESDKKVLVAKRFSSHASVSTLSKAAARGAAVLIPGAAPLDKLESADKALKIDFAVKTQPGSWIDLDGNWAFDQDKEKKNTYNVAAAVSRELGEGEGDKKEKKDKTGVDEMRAFVVSDAEAFGDPVMEQARTNWYLLVEAMRWLGGEESFSGEIVSEEDVRIVHTKAEDQVWFYTTIVGVPTVVGALGALAVARPRRRDEKKPGAKPAEKAVAKEPAKAKAAATDKEPAKAKAAATDKEPEKEKEPGTGTGKQQEGEP